MKKCDRCGTCCKIGVCSIGKEDANGDCIYLIEEKDGKYSCKLILDPNYPMQKLIDNIWFGRGCIIKESAEAFEYYRKTYNDKYICQK